MKDNIIVKLFYDSKVWKEWADERAFHTSTVKTQLYGPRKNASGYPEAFQLTTRSTDLEKWESLSVWKDLRRQMIFNKGMMTEHIDLGENEK